MAVAASRALLALFVTVCAPGWGRTAEKSLWPQNGKQTSVEKDLRDSWEPSILLDGRPVDRFVISANKPTRSHRFTKAGKDSRAHLLEDVDPEWVNLDGFAVLAGAPVGNSTAGPLRTLQTRARNQSSAQRATREDRRARSSGVSSTRTHRRAPQSSSGPRQPERFLAGAPLLERRQHHTKPQSDQRNRHTAKLTSESVHVVSLQAQKAQDQRVPANRPVTIKTTVPEPPEYEARDISVRVLSPKSVLISWVDPAVEMGKVAPGASRFYTVRYREKGESARWEHKESAQRRMMIDTLAADGMYEFSVRISQGENQGKWSVSVFQRTPESAPSGPPESFEVKPLRGKGTAVIATWDPPEEPNGRIREYILSYAPATKPFGMKSVTYSGSTTTATIDGLTPGDRYIFKIRATNRKGQGPQSKAFSVAMPGSSRTVSFSKAKDNHRTGHTPTKQDTDHDESEEPPTLPQPVAAAPINRRLRPLSETRSFHNVFASVRDIGKTLSSRARAKDREDKWTKERGKILTTPPPLEETTTVELDTDNDASPELEDVHYEVEPLTTKTPSLKAVIPSPTKPTLNYLNPPPKRAIKIRVHQKPISKPSSSLTSTSSPPASSSSYVQESAASRKDYVVTTFPQSKATYDKPSLQNKPSTPVVKEAEATPVGRASAGRSSGSGVGSRYINSRRHKGILFRGNSTRLLNGYKFAFSPRSNVPSKNPDQATLNTHSPGASQSTQNNKTSHTLNLATSRSTLGRAATSPSTSDALNLEKSQSTAESQASNPSVSRSGSQLSLSTGKSATVHSASHRPSQSSAKTHNTHASDTLPEQGTNEGTTSTTTAEEPTSSSKRQTAEEQTREDKRKATSTNEKSVASHTKISPSFAERFPWLVSRYPGRFSSVSRTSSSRQDGRTSSSSAGADGPVLRETATRVSGATGAAGVFSIQETSEDAGTGSSHGSGENGAKPSLTSQHTASSNKRSPTSSAASASSSQSTLGSHQSSSGHRGHHAATSNNYNNARNKDYVDERSTGISGKNESRVTQNNPVTTGSDNESVDENETSPRTRSGTSSVVSPNYRQPGSGANGRIRSSVLANRQLGGSRFSIRPKPAQNSRVDSSTSDSTSSLPHSPERAAGSGPSAANTGAVTGSDSRSTSSSSTRDRSLGARSQNPFIRGKLTSGGAMKPGNGNDKNGRPNLTAADVKESSSSHGTRKAVGQKFITGPDGSKWVVDLEKGVLMNQDGKVLQDSQGKPRRVVLGEDGRTIFDHMGSPLVNQEGMALFGHGRHVQPVVNPKEKVLMVGGKQVLGLNPPRVRTTTSTTTTTTTTTPVATTTDWASEEYTTALAYPSCPPRTFSRTDAYGYPVLDAEGILDCYPEEESSGMELDLVTVTMVPDALALDEDELFEQTTPLSPTTTTTTTTTTTETTTPQPPNRPFNKGPSSEFDLSGKKRFTAPFVDYIQKDPSAPCSLTEALEYLQVDILEGLMNNDSVTVNQKQPPKDKPHNVTVIAMEGCHSFIILDWARPLKNEMVSGYMVHSASYDDVLNNRWSSRSSSGTHLAVENLKPNSRYYFKVQAKNVFGLGPFSDTLTYVTESDDPLLIERPPGGEPIWIPFTFKYNPSHSSCKGSQYVKRTWYRKFVGVVLCNSLRYKIFMGDGLREPFYSIGDTFGLGEDHCQFVDSYRDGRTGPVYHSNNLPSAQGFYRAYRQEPVTFGVIGRRTPHPFVGWYECGVPIPGKW